MFPVPLIDKGTKLRTVSDSAGIGSIAFVIELIP